VKCEQNSIKEVKMIVVLTYRSYGDDEYDLAISRKPGHCGEFHKLMVSDAAVLQVGAEVCMTDYFTYSGIDFKITRQSFDADKNILSLLVVMSDTDLTPEEFANYIVKNWVNYNKIKDLAAAMP